MFLLFGWDWNATIGSSDWRHWQCRVLVLVSNFPDIGFGTHRELEVLLSDTIPVLVYHHHTQKRAYRAKEHAINVMIGGFAELGGKGQLEELTKDKEDGAENNVTYVDVSSAKTTKEGEHAHTQRPHVIQRVQNEHDLQNDVDKQHASVK